MEREIQVERVSKTVGIRTSVLWESEADVAKARKIEIRLGLRGLMLCLLLSVSILYILSTASYAIMIALGVALTAQAGFVHYVNLLAVINVWKELEGEGTQGE